MAWIDAELALIALAAMLSPTTLSFSIFALVLGDRPLRTGFWFYLGAMTATLAIGVVAAFVIGDAAASDTSTPKTWVAIVDLVAAGALLAWIYSASRRPPDPARRQAMIDRMSGLATAPAGNHRAIYRDRNVWIGDSTGAAAIQITTDGSEKSRVKYGTASWVYGEELSQRTAMWCLRMAALTIAPMSRSRVGMTSSDLVTTVTLQPRSTNASAISRPM